MLVYVVGLWILLLVFAMSVVHHFNCKELMMSRPSLAAESSVINGVPLFVVGCDRSGTTLLTTLIESRLGLAAPLETHFIPYFAKTLFLWGDLSQSRNRARLLTAIYHFSEILLVQNYPQKESAAIRAATLLATCSQAEAILAQSSSFGEMIAQLFSRFAAVHHKQGWVDNSSFYEVIGLQNWQRHLPDMKVIHIVRDGRDVALSWLQSWWGPASLGEAAQLWAAHVEDKRAWGRANPERYLELTYEALLDDAEGVLVQIAHFLALDLQPVANDSPATMTTANILSTGGTHELLSGPILGSNQEKWRLAMSAADQRLFEYVAGESLQSGGYATLYRPFALRETVHLSLQQLLAGVRRFLTLIYYAKKVKWLMPVVFFMAGPLGAWIVRLFQDQQESRGLDRKHSKRA